MINKDEIISKARQFALEHSENDDIHGFKHIERVFNTCIKIGKKLNANLQVLKISALLHDIGRINEKTDSLKRNHAEISAEKAMTFLLKNQFPYSKNDFNNIIHSIKAHSFSNEIIPTTLEAKILSDSDKLDALGAIGIYRTIGYTIRNNGNIDKVIEHLEEKIMKLKEQMILDISRKIAEKRQEIVVNFYYKLKEEKE